MLDEVQLPVDSRADVASRGFEVRLVNLVNDLDALVALLSQEVARGSWLNAFLLAAGVNQILEDYLHEDRISLPRVARHVRRTLPGLLGAVPAGAVATAGLVRRSARDAGRSDRHTIRWQRQLATIVDDLASRSVSADPRIEARTLERSMQALVATLSQLPLRARRSVVRLPSCFRSFDQRPDDLARLTEMFTDRWPDRARPIAVVGVRTSGSYTAPLHAAYLRRAGYRDVSALTVRPRRGWRRWERQAIERVRSAEGLVLVTDDPPKSGGSILTAMRELEEQGLPAAAIVPVIQVFDAAALSPELRKYDPIVLEARDWSVQAHLEPHAVRHTLAGMLHNCAVISVERTPLTATAARGHVSATYRIRVQDRETGQIAAHEIFVKGVGLGYFGEHTLAVLDAVRRFVPEVIGLRDGLLYRRWLPESARLRGTAPARTQPVAQAIAAYTLARAAGMRIDDDLSLRLVDRGAVWQRASDTVARSFGRWAQFARPLSHPLARALLRVDEPSVIDGSTDITRWFDGGKSGIRKVDFEERGLSSLDVFCFDPRFDVAGSGTTDLAAAVRAEYARGSGRPIDPETWLLYRLVHAIERHRDEPAGSPEAEREAACEMQGYYAETVFSDLSPAGDGPLCAADLDWTLEGHALGFPSITPAAALALHALTRHGYRVVLATGRSVAEVTQRCEAYRLAGGVAEYGAAIYEHAGRTTRVVLTPDERAALSHLRAVLARTPGIAIDPLYRYAVRAYSFGESGRRRGLTPEVTSAAMRSAGLDGSVRAIQGAQQTDFMVNTVDKGVGMRALAERLGAPAAAAGGARLELALGDSSEDLPFIRLARVAFTPNGSELASRSAGVHVLGDSGPRSLRTAATMLLGHRPGHCDRCRVVHLSPRSLLLLSMLGAQDSRGWGRVTQALRVAARLHRFAR